MAIAELHTRKKIVDVADANDSFDIEYRNRVMSLNTINQLRDLIADYEEFLPEGLQRFRSAGDREIRMLLKQVKRHVEHARHGRVLADPNEGAALFSPPMISMPRMVAISIEQEEAKKGRSVKITWGQAFRQLAIDGKLTQLANTQEMMFRRVIEIKDQVKEMVDTKWMPGERNVPGEGGGIEVEAPGGKPEDSGPRTIN